MNKVEPIRDVEKVKKMKVILKNRSYRDYILFELGINSGLRISDLLKLRVKDIKNRDIINLKEKKTGKQKEFALNPKLKANLNDYVMNMEDEEYLFQSRKGDNKPISRTQAYRVLKSASKELNLDKIGTHTLRKTYGYHHYKQNKDIAILQEIFNHSSPSITKKYIGLSQDEINNSTKQFYI